MLEAVVLAVALAMDATALAAASSACGGASALTLRMAWLFAAFHVAMVTVGWMVGAAAERWISTWDHWVAFGLLVAIGIKMVWSAMRPGPVEVPTSWRVLIGLAIATSLDAVAAGVTLPLVDAPEVVTIGMIGGVVFGFVLAGGWIGVKLGERFGRGLQVAGGVAIVGLGVKTLVDHFF